MSRIPLLRSTYAKRVLRTSPGNLIGYWKLDEPVGTTGANSVKDSSGRGFHGTPTDVVFGDAGIGDGGTGATTDGATSTCVDIYSAGFAAAFGKTEGTVALWSKMVAGGWNDTAYKQMFNIGATSAGNVLVLKDNVINKITYQYIGGANTETISETPAANYGWVHYAVTWSKTGDLFSAYRAGGLINTSGTLGTWANALNSTKCVIGSANTGSGIGWIGGLAHFSVWNTPLTAAQIASLAKVA